MDYTDYTMQCEKRSVSVVCMHGEELWCFWSVPYPSGPLKHFSVDHPQLFLLKIVLQVFRTAGIVDKDGQQDHGCLEEEVQ